MISRGTSASPRFLRLGLPDAVQVQPQHGVRVQYQPAALVRRQIGPEHLAHARQGAREVEVVVERGHESVVQLTPGRGQGSRGRMGPIRDDVPGSAPETGDARRRTHRSVARRAGRQHGGCRPWAVRRRRAEPGEARPQRCEPSRGRVERLVGVVELPPVARRERQVAERQRVEAPLRELGHALEVAGGLGHLATGHQQMLPVDPDRGGRAADERRGLRDLVLVVREDVVDATGVQVESIAQVAPRHRRAFEVPAGIALAPARGRPLQGPSLAGALPQGEVRRVALVRFHVAAVTGAQVVERVARQPPVPGERRHRVVHVAFG